MLRETNLYFSHELQSTTAQREHLGCLCAEGECMVLKSYAVLQLVVVRYARLIFNLMVNCDSNLVKREPLVTTAILLQ